MWHGRSCIGLARQHHVKIKVGTIRRIYTCTVSGDRIQYNWLAGFLPELSGVFSQTAAPDAANKKAGEKIKLMLLCRP